MQIKTPTTHSYNCTNIKKLGRAEERGAGMFKAVCDPQ